MKKTIKFVHRYRGWSNANPHGGLGQQPGDVITCDQKRADWFVKNDWAVLVEEKKERKVVEVAVVKPGGERAILDPKPEKRGPGRPPKINPTEEKKDANV